MKVILSLLHLNTLFIRRDKRLDVLNHNLFSFSIIIVSFICNFIVFIFSVVIVIFIKLFLLIIMYSLISCILYINKPLIYYFILIHLFTYFIIHLILVNSNYFFCGLLILYIMDILYMRIVYLSFFILDITNKSNQKNSFISKILIYLFAAIKD